MPNQHTVRRLSPNGKRGYKYYFQTGKIEVDEDTGCWIWLGSQFPDGYGKIRSLLQGIPIRAQAYFYELYKGSPHGLDVGHNCHRRLCVRMRHLVAMSHSDNMRLMFADYPIGQSDKDRIKELWQQGDDFETIADALMMPRPVLYRVLPTLDLQQINFDL